MSKAKVGYVGYVGYRSVAIVSEWSTLLPQHRPSGRALAQLSSQHAAPKKSKASVPQTLETFVKICGNHSQNYTKKNANIFTSFYFKRFESAFLVLFPDFPSKFVNCCEDRRFWPASALKIALKTSWLLCLHQQGCVSQRENTSNIFKSSNRKTCLPTCLPTCSR